MHKLTPESWVERYGDILYRYIIARVFEKEIAEDLVQDTFLAALKAMPSFKGNSSEKTWLFAILKNKLVDYFRNQQRQKGSQVNFSSPFKDSGLFFRHWKKEHGPMNWELDSVESILESGEFMRIFEYCLSLLPPKMASVFGMKVIEEIESDAVCKEMGISASNLWVIMHRARLQLRECLEEKWINE